MAFRDIGRKVTETGQGAVQKSKDFTESARLNAEIGNLEKENEKNYTEIGRIYYGGCWDQPQDPQLQPWFQKVSDNLQKIEENRKRIEWLKGAKTCANCGGLISPDAAFCRHCGEPVVLVAAPVGLTCPNCGAQCYPDDKFCVVCGQRLDQGNPAPAPDPQPVNPVCQTCGAVLDADARFCVNCGTPVPSAGAAGMNPGFASDPMPFAEPEIPQSVLNEAVGYRGTPVEEVESVREEPEQDAFTPELQWQMESPVQEQQAFSYTEEEPVATQPQAGSGAQEPQSSSYMGEESSAAQPEWDTDPSEPAGVDGMNAPFQAAEPQPGSIAQDEPYAPVFDTADEPAPPLDEPTQAAFIFCIHCGEKLPAGTKYCINCGKRVEV